MKINNKKKSKNKKNYLLSIGNIYNLNDDFKN